MKSYRKELWFNVPTRRTLINITPQVKDCLRESGIREGLCLVNATHITASVLINDDESGLHTWAAPQVQATTRTPGSKSWPPTSPLANIATTTRAKPVPRNRGNNADAHTLALAARASVKRQVMGRKVVVAVTAGKLVFGPWEQTHKGCRAYILR